MTSRYSIRTWWLLMYDKVCLCSLKIRRWLDPAVSCLCPSLLGLWRYFPQCGFWRSLAILCTWGGQPLYYIWRDSPLSNRPLEWYSPNELFFEAVSFYQSLQRSSLDWFPWRVFPLFIDLMKGFLKRNLDATMLWYDLEMNCPNMRIFKKYSPD